MTIQQRLQPLLLLRLIPVLCQHLHVPCVRSRTIDSLGGSSRLAKLLCHQAILEVREAWRLLVVALGQEHVPYSQLLGFCLEIVDYRGVVIPSVAALIDLCSEYGVGALDGGQSMDAY
jgi:hypothetical protein